MLDKQILRNLALEVLSKQSGMQFANLAMYLEPVIERSGLFPTQEECQKIGTDHRYYAQNKLNPIDVLNLNEIIWDLISERIVTPGADYSNNEWPWLRLTEFGKSVVQNGGENYHDTAAYIQNLRKNVASIDNVIVQYVSEGLACYRRTLFFGSAVMFGAASEKLILLFLDGLSTWEKDPQVLAQAKNLIENPKLPKIFSLLNDRIDKAAKAGTIPYEIHQGVTAHLVSLFEMIRVHRNDAVHPKHSSVNRNKLLLTINSFPVAVESVYRLLDFFGGRSGLP